MVALLALAAGAFLWLRHSSLVAVRRVTITGISGPDAAQIRQALQSAAQGMSTLAVSTGRLHAAVTAYPVVRALHVSTDFPHGLRIAVSEQVPVALVRAGGQSTAVSADGTLLRQGADGAGLPTIALSVPPGGSHLTGVARQEAALLGAAPYSLLARIATAGQASGRGLTGTLRNGPSIYFGDASQLRAKWSAALAVLASPTSAGADYIDVSDPGRPAAGTGSDTPSIASTGSAAGAAATATTPATSTASSGQSAAG